METVMGRSCPGVLILRLWDGGRNRSPVSVSYFPSLAEQQVLETLET